jgi:DNA-binding transcriptional ArsR family regulator
MVIRVTNNVLGAFLTKPNEKLHLADISRTIKAPHPTVRQWLNKLEKAGVLKKEHKGRLTLYSLKLESPNIIDYLTIAEKNNAIKKYEESLILKELSSELQKNLPENTKAIIFGSAAENPAKAEDIDLLITGGADDKAIKALGKKLNKEIHLINVKSLRQLTKALKDEIIKKHIIIKGTEDVLRWMIWQA